jgi:hypothetical protein
VGFSGSTLAIFLETWDRGKWPPNEVLIYAGIGCLGIS